MSEDIRKYINILTEAQYIRYPSRLVRIKTARSGDYEFYRLSMAFAADNIVNVSLLGEDKIVIFYTEQELEQAKKLWDEIGIEYEVMTETHNDCELPDTNVVSPVPKNPWIKS